MPQLLTTAYLATLALAGCLSVDDLDEAELSETSDPLFVASTKLWATGDIPVCWDTTGRALEKGWVRDAVRRTWEAEGAVELTGWGDCTTATTTGIRITVEDSWPMTLGLGRDLDNVTRGMVLNFDFQAITGFETCRRTGRRFEGPERESCIRAIAAHELGHALGFAHEHKRGDTPSTCTETQGSPGDTPVGAWDVMSIMNYCNPTWNNGGVLSGTDIRGLQQSYGNRRPIAATTWTLGRADAFTQRTDGMVGSTLAASLGRPISGAPTTVSPFPGRVDTFWRGIDGTLQTQSWNGAQWSFVSQVLPAEFFGSPVAISRALHRMDVFVRGTDSRLYVTSWNGSFWSGFVGLGGQIVGTPSVITTGTNLMDVFARGVDGGLYTASFDGASWSAMTRLGPEQIAGNPMAVVTGPNQVSVLVRGTDDALYHRGRSYGVWDPTFTNLGGVILGDPAAASWSANRLDIFVRGTDSMLYTKSWNGTSWSGYGWLGGPILASPTVVSTAPNRLTVYVRGTDSNLYNKTWNGSAWGSFAPLGTTVR